MIMSFQKWPPEVTDSLELFTKQDASFTGSRAIKGLDDNDRNNIKMKLGIYKVIVHKTMHKIHF